MINWESEVSEAPTKELYKVIGIISLELMKRSKKVKPRIKKKEKFKCDFCPEVFTTESNLNRHKNNIHHQQYFDDDIPF